MMTEKKRLDAAVVMDRLYVMRVKVHYPPGDVRVMAVHDISTMDQLNKLLAAPGGISIDCSQAGQLVCHLAGWEDPSGYDYRQDCATGALLANHGMKHFSNAADAELAGIVVFGPGSGQHTAFVRHPGGNNPGLWSHGQESDPRYVPLSVEKADHKSPTTFLSVINL